MTRCGARAFVALVAFVPLACVSEASTSDAATSSADVVAATREITRQGDRHRQGWVLNDADSITAVYAPDAVIMFHEAPDVRGRDVIRQSFAAMLDSTRVQSLVIRRDTIEVHGGSATEWGTYTEVVKPANAPAVTLEGRYVMTWQRQSDGTWMIGRFTGNLLKPAEM